MTRLQLWYEYIIKKDFIYKCQTYSVSKIPSLNSIILNLNNNKAQNILSNITAMELITNQKPIFYTAKKSIAVFKLRQGALIGCKVSLRKKYMFDFLDMLIFMVLSKISTFNGFTLLSMSKGKKLAISLGLSDLTFFVSLNKYSERFHKDSGCTITFINNNSNYVYQNILLTSFQLPQKNNNL